MSNWTGVLDLNMEKRGERTVARDVYFHGAFKVMRPIYHEKNNYPCYYLLNPGGGYLDGDRYRMNINLDEGSELTLTTQSSTKVYKTPNKEAYQENTFNLKKYSYLEYIPDALIAYKDAKYLQKNRINMEKGSTLIYSDILTPGWSPEGDHFSYEEIRLKTEIYMERELVLYDHILLEPKSQDILGLGHMEGYTHLGSLIVISDKTDSDLLDEIYEEIKKEDGDFSFGISELEIKGFTLRIMANYTQVIERIIHRCHEIISDRWYNKKPSFLRKY